MLLEFVEAEYSALARAEGREGEVVLSLTIDGEGHVSRAEIAESAAPDLDQAARAAALRFRFAPATRDGAPIPSRILYTYSFKLADPLEGGAAVEPQASDPAATTTDVLAADISDRSYRPLPPARQTPIEITIRGKSKADRLRESAEAVQVVETEEAQRQTADLGEVLARTQGVGVRRGGGLGSVTRFSLNGLTDDQIRFFIDGIPLAFSGYPFGIANVPLNLVERVEIYRGVVPIRFGADALGGAVNLVTDDHVAGSRGSASYQAGSFGTQRLTFGARHLHEQSGVFARAGGFFDYADNDYPVKVEVPDLRPARRGQLTPARAYRFHDAYRATGGNVEVGFVERPWARRLLLRVFVTDYDKELQHNVDMTRPYGEVEFGELSTGATLRYENVLAKRLSLSAVGGYTYSVREFLDVSRCVYNWFGQCVRVRESPVLGGETESPPRESDRVVREQTAFGRVDVRWRMHSQHKIRLSLSPTYSSRRGDERRQPDPTARDPLTAQRDLFTLVAGLEFELDLLEDRLESIFFVKGYLQVLNSEEPRPGGIIRERDRTTQRPGLGSALRYRLLDWVYAKASYEWATRLPQPDELFGDNVLVLANLELKPEVSHNANVSMALRLHDTPAGAWRAEVNGFLRDADQLIVRLGNDRTFSHQNVFGARSLGLETALGWTSPGEYVDLDGNLTYFDFRNTSDEGTFGMFEGERIPNRPYLFANGSARFQLRRVAAEQDELALIWNTRFVHKFFRAWESDGARSSKAMIDPQLLHSLALTYLVRGNPLALSFTSEVQNLTDEPAFDFFGVQRPGRAFYFKTTAEF